ncbi:MAG TPA: GtrA family protein [Candidatus Humimicrobiaceae bacterium]|nr:GtrA family protein [Candidatus Humimicrobiaceae bacterium]
MKKTDAIISPVIGLFIGVFLFISLRTLQINISQSWLLIIIFPPLTLFGLFTASIIGKKFSALYQIAKFVLVGALNTMIDLGALNFLMSISGIYTGVFYSIFKGLSFLTASTNSYFWNKHWTFEKREEAFVRQEYFKFLVIVGIGFLINVGIATFVVNIIGPQFGISEELWANVGAFVAILFAWVWNFTGAKFIVFKK